MPLGGLGIVVAAILFFAWRKSRKGWQQGIAWLAGIWGVLSILYFVIGLSIISDSASRSTTPPTSTKKPKIYSTALPKTKTPTLVLMRGCPENTAEINIRTGPGTQFAKVGTLRGPACAFLLGRNEDGSWIFVSVDQKPGWIKASLLSASGNIYGLPIKSELSSVTKTPDPKFLADLNSRLATSRAHTTQIFNPGADNPSCESLAGMVGRTVSCKVERAYCSYLPSVSGSPTFCNEAPYPNNYFTLVVWDKDWSDLDGHCLIIKGSIYRYEGGLQIEAGSRSQISFCD